MSEIKAIETEYAGCRFRSRLEARWAVFFDHLGIRWHYEEEGYELSSGRYLPDFRLERAAHDGKRDVWVEVKGKISNPALLKMLHAAVELPCATPDQVTHKLLVLGDVPEPGGLPSHSCLLTLGSYLLLQEISFARGQDRYEIKGRSDVFAADPKLIDSLEPVDTEGLRRSMVRQAYLIKGVVDQQVDDAYRAARSARFEFGERG